MVEKEEDMEKGSWEEANDGAVGDLGEQLHVGHAVEDGVGVGRAGRGVADVAADRRNGGGLRGEEEESEDEEEEDGGELRHGGDGLEGSNQRGTDEADWKAVLGAVSGSGFSPSKAISKEHDPDWIVG